MQDEKKVTSAFVQTVAGAEYALEYLLRSRKGPAGSIIYGVTIQSGHDNEIETESTDVSTGEEQTLFLIERLARHFVFPCTLHDILDDMQFRP